MKFLFLFMDGVGLGVDDPLLNPLVAEEMPNLKALLDGNHLAAGIPPLETRRASLRALDAVMEVLGLPQSATGQASLLTGKNVSDLVGKHYGPKPNRAVRDVLAEGTLFSALTEAGYRAGLLNAYPDQYFKAISSGRRLYSAIPQAVANAGILLNGQVELFAGKALSADFTGEGWRDRLGLATVPVYSPGEAGAKMVELTNGLDLAFFEFWPSDYAGHRQNWDDARALLAHFDRMLGGLLSAWEDQSGLVLITSDHGNLEALDTRRHTANLVPALVIGAPELRQQFVQNLQTLADVAPAILQFYPGARL
ncbi:MAG: alkaline phosphatase family protein [Anaerolineales bacterium]|nr:alkaline phosphatase family protein [Anaerolineales bacterium]